MWAAPWCGGWCLARERGRDWRGTLVRVFSGFIAFSALGAYGPSDAFGALGASSALPTISAARPSSRLLPTTPPALLDEALGHLAFQQRLPRGQADLDHMRKMIRICRVSEVAGRSLVHFGLGPLNWVAGVMALASARILDNMEATTSCTANTTGPATRS